MSKDISIEYAHIYTNKQIGEEQRLSLEILGKTAQEFTDKHICLVVLVDDYSFPDPSFDYEVFSSYLGDHGFKPDFILRESQLIPVCDEVLKVIYNAKLQKEIGDYVRTKKYPCSLFVATWYLLRLGCIKNPIFDTTLVAEKLVNILPVSFKPFEDKAFEIIASTGLTDPVTHIENRYFEGRQVS